MGLKWREAIFLKDLKITVSTSKAIAEAKKLILPLDNVVFYAVIIKFVLGQVEVYGTKPSSAIS